jgi:hypothetical protein
MRLVQRLLAPVGFSVVAFCYGLPFAALRLDDPAFHLAQTFSGRDLVIGGRSRPHIEALLGDPATMDVLPSSEIPPYLGGAGVAVHAQPAFMVAIVLVIAGLAAAILAGDRMRAVVSAVAGSGAAAAMGLGAWLFLHPSGDPFGLAPVFRFVPAYGFWLALALLVGLAVDGFVLSLRPPRAPAPASPEAEALDQVDERGQPHPGGV